jgi:hypothetical protein
MERDGRNIDAVDDNLARDEMLVNASKQGQHA